MAHSYHHALSSANKWGGTPSDYQPIHDWLDGSKIILADFRHRALRHHAEGCWAAQAIFGTVITNSDGRAVPVRMIAEQERAARRRSGPRYEPVMQLRFPRGRRLQTWTTFKKSNRRENQVHNTNDQPSPFTLESVILFA